MQLELTYAVTAWTKAVEDEHRLLSQVLAILFSYGEIPAEVLGANARPRRCARAETSVGRPREEKADFWTSVGGQYKASIDYVVQIDSRVRRAFVRGPEVRTHDDPDAMLDGRPESTMQELHRFGGTVSDSDGVPVAGAWVALPDAGRWAVERPATAASPSRGCRPGLAPGGGANGGRHRRLRPRSRCRAARVICVVGSAAHARS